MKLSKLNQVMHVIFFSTKKAVKATKENLTKLEEQRLLLEEENIKRLNVAKELALSLHDKFVVLIKQASEDGKILVL